MTQKSELGEKIIARASILLLLVLLGGCAGFNRIGRSYAPIPFNSQKWRDGDAQIRGTMFVDLFKKRIVNGKTKDDVLMLLGEPDKKSIVNDSEIWQYRVEFAGENPVQSFSVTFDKNGKAAMGASQTARLFHEPNFAEIGNDRPLRKSTAARRFQS
ncbi:MAG TPA: hypothetical protein VNB22_12465 [Pyrinomonadaceae bacterium]|nr:hypothetical protein [Pyrinomonadaceae bacterium]